MALVDGCVDVRSSRRSASRLTCRIASRPTTTRVPPSATTAAVCCGACTDKASSVKVGSHFFYFCNVKQKLCCVCVTQRVSFLFSPHKQTVAWTFIATARRKWPISVESTRNYWQKLCVKSPRFALPHVVFISVNVTRGGKMYILYLYHFFLFRNLSRSLKTQMQQTLESTKMSVMQQQTLVVRFTHWRTRSWTISAIHWIQNGSYNFLPKLLSLKRSNAFIHACVLSICGHLRN